MSKPNKEDDDKQKPKPVDPANAEADKPKDPPEGPGGDE